jgi:hypothetical protein
MRLVCKKYRWYDGSITGDNVFNFFSTAEKVLESTIDLKYYLIKNTLSDVEIPFENINEVTNGLDIQMSNLSFQCKNEILGRDSLQDFFEVYNSTNQIGFRLYYYNDNDVLLFSGLISKSDVDFSERSKDILDIISVTEEKEFIDYYSNQELRMPVNPATWISAETLYGIPTSGNEVKLLGLRYIELGNLIRINFLTVDLDNYPANHYVAEKPFTYAPFSAGVTFAEMSDLMHIRSGYEQFRMDGVKIYEFFSSLFQEKGWIWYFRFGKLNIRERGGNNLTSTNLNFQTDFKSHSVSNNFLEKQVDSITVFNGNYFDNQSSLSALHVLQSGLGEVRYYLGGEIRHVVSSAEVWTKTRPFVNLEYRTLNDSKYYLMNLTYLDYSRYISDTDKDLIRYRVTNGNNVYTFNPSERGSINYSKQRTLIIEPITVSENNAAGIDLNNARANSGAYYGLGNFYKAAQTSTDSMIFYKGTPASSMVRYSPAENKFYTHEIDCRTQRYRDNFKKFIKSINPVLFDVEIYGVITEPFQNITISNYPYQNSISSKTFAIQKLSFNDLNKTTILTLQMI